MSLTGGKSDAGADTTATSIGTSTTSSVTKERTHEAATEILRSVVTKRDPAGEALTSISKALISEIKDLRQELIRQFEGFLEDPSGRTTGGAQIPIIAQAVESARKASSEALVGVREELARTGLAGTPFGARAFTEQRTQGELAASQAEVDIMKQLFSLIPTFVLAQNQAGLTGLAQAIGSNVTTTTDSTRQLTSTGSKVSKTEGTTTQQGQTTETGGATGKETGFGLHPKFKWGPASFGG